MIVSSITPGNGYAPTIPFFNSNKDNKLNLKDLLVRAKAGLKTGDLIKEAHLHYYLALIYEASKNYKKAAKFYKKFFLCGR